MRLCTDLVGSVTLREHTRPDDITPIYLTLYLMIFDAVGNDSTMPSFLHYVGENNFLKPMKPGNPYRIAK